MLRKAPVALSNDAVAACRDAVMNYQVPAGRHKASVLLSGNSHVALLFLCATLLCAMDVDYRLIAELPEKADIILKHWGLMDYFLPADLPLIVLERYDRAAFQEKFRGLDALKDKLSAHVLTHKTAVAAFAEAKKGLYKRMKHFRWIMAGYWRGSHYFSGVPLLPGLGVGDDLFFDPAVRMRITWRKIAAVDPLPPGAVVAMDDGYGAEDFARDLQALRDLREDEALAALDVRIVRSELAFLYAELVGVVMAYGHSARGRLPADAPLIALIPRTWKQRTIEANAVTD